MDEKRQSGDRVIVIGAGIGGLCSAIALSAQGFDVTVIERQGDPGGKMRTVPAGGLPVDSGPTVFTMVRRSICLRMWIKRSRRSMLLRGPRMRMATGALRGTVSRSSRR